MIATDGVVSEFENGRRWADELDITRQQFENTCEMYGVQVTEAPDTAPALPRVRVTHGVRRVSNGPLLHWDTLDNCKAWMRNVSGVELVALDFGGEVA